jgi:hypothetical protein
MDGVARMGKPDPQSCCIGQPTGRGSEVLIEFQRLGNAVQVTAVDPVT